MNQLRPLFLAAFAAMTLTLTMPGCGEPRGDASTLGPATSGSNPANKVGAEQAKGVDAAANDSGLENERQLPTAGDSGNAGVAAIDFAVDPAVAPAVESGKDPVEPPALRMPPVVMSQEHASTCLVRVGDQMSVVNLPDIQGNAQSLAQMRGAKLTVVFFWSQGDVYSTAELADLGPDVLDKYGSQGVNVVGIHVGTETQLVGAAVTDAKATFPILLDADGAALAKVSTLKPPVTYLLDAEGRVLWLDIGYTRETRRALDEAIRYILAQG